MKVRIGIDVGGTFTDAVAINGDTYELIGYLKIPTTHTSKEGVAAGIVNAVRMIMEKYEISPDDVVFIAHGTTQATNALLEGDVAHVGIVGCGNGLEGKKASNDTNIGNIELAKGKFLYTEHEFVDTSKSSVTSDIVKAISSLLNRKCEVIVASGAFSVDDPSKELAIMEECKKMELPSTGSHEISKLYGLKIRTQTAAINASILPKMIETADMTNLSVKKADIKAPLMIMRCDGGVMDVNEVKKRPVLTMLSGPAAGVAGALMYEKISNGIFLEVGGTSTDMSAIKDGQVMIKYAQVGGHKTYVNSLDVRTVGIAGGSMIRLDSKGVVDVGPRSAHIANLPYACFTKDRKLDDAKLRLFCPKEGDPEDYAAFDCEDGFSYTLTVSCAANYLNYVDENCYSRGDRQQAEAALKIAGEYCNMTAEQLAREIMDKAVQRVVEVVEGLIRDYGIEKSFCVLVGGGGGAASVVPYTAEKMGIKHKIARNAEVISPIGVALAMVRDMVERVVLNPTDDDILRIRQEAYNSAVNSGANPDTISVQVEIDTSKNVVRAIATGATQLRTKEIAAKPLTEDEIIEKGKESFGDDISEVKILKSTGQLYVVQGLKMQKSFFGLFTKKEYPVRIIDNEGVVRLQKKSGYAVELRSHKRKDDLGFAIEHMTTYSDGGEEIPDVYILFGKQMKAFTGLITKNQVLSLADVELKMIGEDEKVIAFVTGRK